MSQQLAYDKKNDFYDMLGVNDKTDAKQIKLAYYKMAQKYHPDRAGDKDQQKIEKFKSISNAYEVLVDETQRQKYDKLRMEARQTSAYHSKRSQQSAGAASGYKSRRRDAQDDFFYGNFKTKDDFYDFFSSSAKQ